MENSTVADVVENWSLVASIVSVLLAVIAIALSVIFFWMTSKINEKIQEASKDIHFSVERLSALFDKMYSDTFSIVKDTVTDMRRYAWPADKTAESVEASIVEAQVEELRKEFDGHVEEILKKQRLSDDKIQKISDDISEFYMSRIERPGKDTHLRNLLPGSSSEDRRLTLRILAAYRELEKTGKGDILANELVGVVTSKFEYRFDEVVSELQNMKERGLLFWDGDLGPRTILVKKDVGRTKSKARKAK